MIPIQNIYYMLSYAFRSLNEQGYKSIATEHFDNVAELCAAILTKGVSIELKRGLNCDYIGQQEAMSALRGKIEISDSVKEQTMLRKQMICSYDEFSVNSYQNQIIKTTMELLLRSDISAERKCELRKLLVYFNDVEVLDIYNINWELRYNRNNQNYRMLVSICYLVIKGLLQTQSNGTTKLMDFLDDQNMCDLYERFIREYYKKAFPQLKPSASHIKWVVSGDDAMLPRMRSDIMLTYQDTVLIIDAKYYEETTQSWYGANTIHSNNLYQIFTYVKNKDESLKGRPHKVSGMLLYARTNEREQPDQTYVMSGNRIDVRTLDLNCDFSIIKEQLNGIVTEFFGDYIVREEA